MCYYVFRKWKTRWRFAECVAKFCENSLKCPKPTNIQFIFSIHTVAQAEIGHALPGTARSGAGPGHGPKRRCAPSLRIKALDHAERSKLSRTVTALLLPAV